MEPSGNVVGDGEKNCGLSGGNHRAGFGRHVAHKQQDTMGEILQSHVGIKFNRYIDSVDNQFKEIKHPENGDAVQVDTDLRHRAHKHHDTMGEIIHNGGDTNCEKFKYSHDSDFVDKRVNKINSENVEVCQVNTKGRKGASKYQDTMGEIIKNGADFEKFKYNRGSDFVDNRFKETNVNSKNEGEQLTDMDGHYVKKDIKFHHNPIW